MTDPRRPATLLAITLGMLAGIAAPAQSTNHGLPFNPAGFEVTQIVGLPDAKPNIKGHLTMSGGDLVFTNAEFAAQIPFARMTSVSTGNVRVETGGKKGQIVRKVIPYGGGLALATVTQKSVGLLTIEYLDLRGGYHGTVFSLADPAAKDLGDRIAARLETIPPAAPPSCEGRTSNPNAVVIEPVASTGVELPAEYRVLLYEGLVSELRDSPAASTYSRAGSTESAAGCSVMKLRVTVTGFKKGNQALRASTGPIGLFVGKTSVSFHVTLTAADGHSLLAEDMTNSKRMDTESLGVAKSVAKAVSKKIHKLPANKLVS